MQKNFDRRIVVIDVEMFARLLEYANIGEFEAGQVTGSSLTEIKRHVNKQNTFLGKARTRTSIEEGKERKELSKLLKRKARYISTRKTVKFWYVGDNRLVPATIANNDQRKGVFHNWGNHRVSIFVNIYYPKNHPKSVAAQISVTDLLSEDSDGEYIAYLMNHEGYIKEDQHDH